MTINLTQSILRRQFPSVAGLEHTELGLRNTFMVRKSSFVHILYANYHWVTVSGNEKGNISFYDSLNNGNIPQVFLHQICDIIRPGKKVFVKSQPVQQQANHFEALVTYEQASLRFYLNRCLKLGKFFHIQL